MTKPFQTFSTLTGPVSLLAATAVMAAAGCSNDVAHAGRVEVQISGEEAATDGFLYPSGSEVTFVDGWELRFSHLLVTVDDITLAENPDTAPANQSLTGAPVARNSGPWAVDLAVPGSVPGAGGEGLATPLTSINAMNLRGGEAFAPDERYAFGYRIVQAAQAAHRVNFADADVEALYARMIERGDVVLYVGTATFKGEDCATGDADYDFESLPKSVDFELGFPTPTAYVNCQNQENQGAAFDGEEYQRGVAIPSNQPAIAQITLHVEHPFFSDTVHDSPIFFDQMASQLVGAKPSTTLTLAHFVGVDPTAFTDGAGSRLPWRTCLADSELPSGKQRHFGVGHVLVDPSGDPHDVFRDYRDYVSYLQSTQGHLNGGEGLCFVERAYPSPL
jgi:hypothetical protein